MRYKGEKGRMTKRKKKNEQRELVLRMTKIHS